jgi:diaminohydroxyphosphoribosylaminopyrimidine deaminase/5-amino-6-(5-phosphoribosylamino)uracil reductase
MQIKKSQQAMVDEQYMRRALALALYGKGQTSPNPMVGAVIVKNDKVIAEGWHKHCGADHAEIDAIKKVKGTLKGATLYVTLEPCGHFGRTPPCVDTILNSGFQRVVIGMKDPNPKTNGQSIARIKKQGIQVSVGILEDEIKIVNEAFVTYMTQNRPLVVAKCAQTLDGKIATSAGESKWITSEYTRQRARYRRDDFDAIVVGINTVLTDNPQLTGMNPKKRLRKIILDPVLRTPLNAKLFQRTLKGQCFIAVTAHADIKKIKLFEKKGVDILICPQKGKDIDLSWLLDKLAQREITSVLVEGGARTIGSFLKQGMVDKMHFYIAPFVFADNQALSSIVGLNTVKLSQAIRFSRWVIQESDQDLFIEAYVYRNH